MSRSVAEGHFCRHFAFGAALYIQNICSGVKERGREERGGEETGLRRQLKRWGNMVEVKVAQRDVGEAGRQAGRQSESDCATKSDEDF